jgi:hypothetical protein
MLHDYKMRTDPNYVASIKDQMENPMMDPDTSMMMYATPEKLSTTPITGDTGGTGGTGGNPGTSGTVNLNGSPGGSQSNDGSSAGYPGTSGAGGPIESSGGCGSPGSGGGSGGSRGYAIIVSPGVSIIDYSGNPCEGDQLNGGIVL